MRELMEGPWKGFSAEEKKKIEDEVEEMFRSIFEIKGDKLDLSPDFEPFEGPEWERLSGTFWARIVEPGWLPSLVERALESIPLDDEETYNAIFDYKLDAQRKAAKKLGIPEDVIEV